jgi:hypothetical protein
MPNVLRPDMKAAVWLAVGFLVVPKVMSMVRR